MNISAPDRQYMQMTTTKLELITRWRRVLLSLALLSVSAQTLAVEAAAIWLERDGHVLQARNGRSALPPASLTKLMTALLTLEKSKLADVVTVGASAASETGTRTGLRHGERLTVEGLLVAMLLGSGNDACRALADHLGPGQKSFVDQMNQRARELGLDKTRFTNACGHDHPQHLSSAHDLARLARIVMEYPFVIAATSRVSAQVSTLSGRLIQVANTNQLVGRFEGATGLKTGYTPRAGKCLVATVERHGRRLQLVLLNAPNRWWDAATLLERALDGVEAGALPPVD